jgi:hypothetical protein
LIVGFGSSANASCARPPGLPVQIDEARVVFVGAVVATTDRGRHARVKVESIWKGPGLPMYVDVSGSPVSGPNTFSSIDRTYQVGQRYLFVPANDQRPIQDNICSATQLYTNSLAAYAPADARGPDPATASDPEQPGTSWLWAAAVVVAVLLAGSAAAVVMRRRRSRHA